jgi:hypothetical protein
MNKRQYLSVIAAAAISLVTAAAQTPRLQDGKPNLNGYWQALNTANFDIQDHPARKGEPGGQGVVEGNEIPYQPWALAKKKENLNSRASLDSEAKCYQLGVPRITYSGHPFQIFQSAAADKITILYEYAHTNRFIYTKNTTHPRGPIEWWMGDSRGHWEGDTLVVDNVHFNDQTWFDEAGNFHSEDLHVVERYTLTDADHINYEVTIEDPKVFTKPWKMNMILYRHKEKNFQLLDYECYAFDDDQYYP